MLSERGNLFAVLDVCYYSAIILPMLLHCRKKSYRVAGFYCRPLKCTCGFSGTHTSGRTDDLQMVSYRVCACRLCHGDGSLCTFSGVLCLAKMVRIRVKVLFVFREPESSGSKHSVTFLASGSLWEETELFKFSVPSENDDKMTNGYSFIEKDKVLQLHDYSCLF